MQKNVPKYAPPWIHTVRSWAETSKRDVSYALCNDRRTLLWFANQRAVEYHPTLVRADRPDRMTHVVLDLDPPDDDAFSMAVRAAHAVRRALADVDLEGAVKTSGAKGVHVFVPIDDQASMEDSAAATRAIAARAERLDPDIATTAFIKEDRAGKVFVDSTPRRRGDRDRGIQPSHPSRGARVLPGGLGRSRRGHPRGLHSAHCAGTPRRPQSLDRPDAEAAVIDVRPHRGRSCHTGGSSAGDARRQAPRPRPPQLRIARSQGAQQAGAVTSGRLSSQITGRTGLCPSGRARSRPRGSSGSDAASSHRRPPACGRR
jgi:hypothetical protein